FSFSVLLCWGQIEEPPMYLRKPSREATWTPRRVVAVLAAAGFAATIGCSAGSAPSPAPPASTSRAVAGECPSWPPDPPIDKSCLSDTDCTFGLHQTDCCGSGVFTGFNRSEADRFAAAEAICESEYPACGCAGRTTTED